MFKKYSSMTLRQRDSRARLYNNLNSWKLTSIITLIFPKNAPYHDIKATLNKVTTSHSHHWEPNFVKWSFGRTHSNHILIIAQDRIHSAKHRAWGVRCLTLKMSIFIHIFWLIGKVSTDRNQLLFTVIEV